MENLKDGYIYIYKCIVGSHSDICKIGKTKNFGGPRDRMRQHGRTTYYGFVPYTDFASGNPIATGFKVKDMKKVDLLIKEFFKEYRMSTLEIYVIDYDLALEKLYYFLRENNQLIMLIGDGVSRYEFLNERENMDNDTSKGQFEKIRDNILEKYNREIPLELLTLLRDRSEFERNCSSHMASGNYIDFPNDLVLDIHYNKIKRIEILNKLKNLL